MRIFTPAVLFIAFFFGSREMFAGETQPFQVTPVSHSVYAINDSGRFAGSWTSLSGTQAYFGSTTSVLTNLGKFGGTMATGVAISRDAAGASVVAVSIDGSSSVIYRKPANTNLGAAVPTDVNGKGWACGWMSVNGNIHAFASNTAGTVVDLTPNATYGYAYAINELDWVVGEIDGVAFRWDPSTFNNKSRRRSISDPAQRLRPCRPKLCRRHQCLRANPVCR